MITTTTTTKTTIMIMITIMKTITITIIIKKSPEWAGLEIATNTVANVTSFFSGG